MSLDEHISYIGDEISECYAGIGQGWPEAETPAFDEAFMGINATYCTEPVVPPTIMTPTSLPDSSFRPSPALSHHSQDYHSEYQYDIGDAIHPQGLGISAPFPSDFPQATAPTSESMYAPDDKQLETSPTPNTSLQEAPPPKRIKRKSSHPPSRDTPVSILPHPEGLQRMERERLNPRSPLLIYPRPRAPGRGRRDPQAEEEDAFVEHLREQNYAWRAVRSMFQERFNKDASEARLQMRLQRRRNQKLVRWDNSDVQRLISANEMWENTRYRFLADKMKELGSTREYTPDQCRAQLQLLEVKESRQDWGSVSPSTTSDLPPSPLPSTSRKRARSLSPEAE